MDNSSVGLRATAKLSLVHDSWEKFPLQIRASNADAHLIGWRRRKGQRWRRADRGRERQRSSGEIWWRKWTNFQWHGKPSLQVSDKPPVTHRFLLDPYGLWRVYTGYKAKHPNWIFTFISWNTTLAGLTQIKVEPLHHWILSVFIASVTLKCFLVNVPFKTSSAEKPKRVKLLGRSGVSHLVAIWLFLYRMPHRHRINLHPACQVNTMFQLFWKIFINF